MATGDTVATRAVESGGLHGECLVRCSALILSFGLVGAQAHRSGPALPELITFDYALP